MAASDFLSGVPPELLARVLRTGQVGIEEDALRQRMARAQAMQQESTPQYNTPWGAALGGLAGVARAGIGAYEERQAQKGIQALGQERDAGRKALVSAYTGGMRQQQVTAPDVIAPNIGMPDATDEQRAQATAERATQQQEREEGVRRGTAYLGLLSGDSVLRDFGRALTSEDAADVQSQRLQLSTERLRQQAELERKRLEQGDKRLTQQAEQAKRAAEERTRALAAKKVADALNVEEGLRKEVMGNPVTRSYLEAQVAFDKVQRAAQDPSAAGDLALIFGVMKTLDPGSTVREGEFANAQNAAGIDGRVIAAYNKILTGERLSPQQRADFVRTAQGQFAAQQSAFQKFVNAYRGVAERAGANVENVLPLGAPSAAPRVAAPPTGGVTPNVDVGAAPTQPVAPSTDLTTKIQQAEAWLQDNPNSEKAPAVKARLEELRQMAGGTL